MKLKAFEDCKIVKSGLILGGVSDTTFSHCYDQTYECGKNQDTQFTCENDSGDVQASSVTQNTGPVTDCA